MSRGTQLCSVVIRSVPSSLVSIDPKTSLRASLSLFEPRAEFVPMTLSRLRMIS